MAALHSAPAWREETVTEPIWQPSAERVAGTNLTRFAAAAEARWGIRLPDQNALWRWSTGEMEQFWLSVWDFCDIVAERRGERVLIDGDRMPGARFFPDARLNFAENLLRRRDDGPAIFFRAEDRPIRRISWAELYAQVSRLARAFRAEGLGPGDRVAAYMPNVPETVVAMLAATSIGAVFSSCSPDFGVQGVLDRFGQIEPRILISADGYRYNGKTHSSLDKLPDILAGVPSLERTVIVPYIDERPDIAGLGGAVLLPDYVADHQAGEIEFTRRGFNDPLYIMYSSGTTGPPKCIVHGIGGSLLQHVKEQRLHCDIRRDDRVFYFTTCGWMMWNWLVSAPAPRPSSSTRWANPAWRRWRRTTSRRCGSWPRPDRPWCPRASRPSTAKSSATSIWRRYRAAPICSPASSAPIPTRRSGRARFNARCWAWPLPCSTSREGRSGASRANWSAPGPSPPCRSVSGTTPATRAITRPITKNTRTSGATATSSSAPSMAAT
jgi:hypothetical protein